MNKEEQWARDAAKALKVGMTPEEIEFIKTNDKYSIPIAGKIKSIASNYSAYKKSLIKAENAAHQILNNYYTNLIRKYL